MSGKKIVDGGKRHRYVEFVATVEGEEHGVPFRVFFKRMDRAEEVARSTRGVLQDLHTLKRVRWVHGEWRRIVQTGTPDRGVVLYVLVHPTTQT